MDERERPGLLDALGPAARDQLMAHARSVRVRKGQSVLARNEASGEVFIVQEGRLLAILYTADGREVSLRDLTVGQLFGELAAIDGDTRSVGIVATTDARLLAIAPGAFRAILRDHPEASDWMIRRLVSQVK